MRKRKSRKQKKREFRQLWITRISAACKMNGINYSQFMNGCKKAGITLNRKMLSELAIADLGHSMLQGFEPIAEEQGLRFALEIDPAHRPPDLGLRQFDLAPDQGRDVGHRALHERADGRLLGYGGPDGR